MKTAAKTSISRSICTDSAEFVLPAGTMDETGDSLPVRRLIKVFSSQMP